MTITLTTEEAAPIIKQDLEGRMGYPQSLVVKILAPNQEGVLNVGQAIDLIWRTHNALRTDPHNRIAAIKEVRAASGLSLIDAKHFVEAVMDWVSLT